MSDGTEVAPNSGYILVLFYGKGKENHELGTGVYAQKRIM
jgi:hypothetical protein